VRTPTAPSRFSSNFTGTPSLKHSRVTMRLTDRQCAMSGEKLLELANYAVAALIFGQLVAAQRISLALMLTGGASYIALVVVALWLTGDA